jgi:hypothetical protein
VSCSFEINEHVFDIADGFFKAKTNFGEAELFVTPSMNWSTHATFLSYPDSIGTCYEESIVPFNRSLFIESKLVRQRNEP